MATTNELLAQLAGKRKGKSRKPKGLPKRTGKRAHKYTKYYASVHDARKLKHLLRRNGPQAARTWAEAHNAEMVLNRLLGRS